MTFKVTILGSSAALPMAGKHHSAHALNVHEQFYLIDCGEGTQTRLGECGINPMKINAVFISHIHGDHVYGLLPLISTMGLMGRKTPLKVFAPQPFGEILDCHSRYFHDVGQFEIQYNEIDTGKHTMIYENSVMEVWSIPLRHRVPSSGFLFREKTPKLNVRKDAISRFGLSVAQIVAAKRGEDIMLDEANAEKMDPGDRYGAGSILPNGQLTCLPYVPRSYAYCSDTMYSGKVAKLVEGVDLLYHEATFSDEDKALARETEHSTTVQAARVAETARVARLLIGHFSGRYKDIASLVAEARSVFPATDPAVEGETVNIKMVRNE